MVAGQDNKEDESSLSSVELQTISVKQVKKKGNLESKRRLFIALVKVGEKKRLESLKTEINSKDAPLGKLAISANKFVSTTIQWWW